MSVSPATDKSQTITTTQVGAGGYTFTVKGQSAFLTQKNLDTISKALTEEGGQYLKLLALGRPGEQPLTFRLMSQKEIKDEWDDNTAAQYLPMSNIIELNGLYLIEKDATHEIEHGVDDDLYVADASAENDTTFFSETVGHPIRSVFAQACPAKLWESFKRLDRRLFTLGWLSGPDADKYVSLSVSLMRQLKKTARVDDIDFCKNQPEAIATSAYYLQQSASALGQGPFYFSDIYFPEEAGKGGVDIEKYLAQFTDDLPAALRVISQKFSTKKISPNFRREIQNKFDATIDNILSCVEKKDRAHLALTVINDEKIDVSLKGVFYREALCSSLERGKWKEVTWLVQHSKNVGNENLTKDLLRRTYITPHVPQDVLLELARSSDVALAFFIRCGAVDIVMPSFQEAVAARHWKTVEKMLNMSKGKDNLSLTVNVTMVSALLTAPDTPADLLVSCLKRHLHIEVANKIFIHFIEKEDDVHLIACLNSAKTNNNRNARASYFDTVWKSDRALSDDVLVALFKEAPSVAQTVQAFEEVLVRPKGLMKAGELINFARENYNETTVWCLYMSRALQEKNWDALNYLVEVRSQKLPNKDKEDFMKKYFDRIRMEFVQQDVPKDVWTSFALQGFVRE